MKTLQFKTNIKCSGCVANVTSELNNTAGENNWQVDIQSPDKILTVTTDQADEAVIVSAVQKAGFKAEKLN